MFLKKRTNLKKKIIYIIISLIFIFLTLTFYRGLKKENVFVPSELIGKKIPEFSSKSLYEENEISSNQLFIKDKYYLINIWASWCAPCRKEHSALMKLSDEKNLSIIGINFKDNKKNAISFLNNEGNPYSKVVTDKKGFVSIDIGSYGIPESILIDKNKIIIFKFIGPLSFKDYKKIINIINKKE